MPAGPVGTCWQSGTWPDTAWEAGSWAAAAIVARLPSNVIVASLVTAEPRRRNTSAQPALSTTSGPVFTNRFDG